MLKAFEVMSRPLATCAPEANVTDVAAIMRDRDIGDVLIVEDGKLRGIVTDRDLTLQALTGQDDPRQTPISKYMSTKIVTGESTWDLTQVSSVMAEHQIRRLPIMQDGKLVGIISLGDVARYEDQNHVVAKSLQAISEPQGVSFSTGLGRGGVLAARGGPRDGGRGDDGVCLAHLESFGAGAAQANLRQRSLSHGFGRAERRARQSG